MRRSHTIKPFVAAELLTDFAIVDMTKVIPSIEQALELQKLHYHISPDDEETIQRVRELRVLLCCLRYRELGFQ
jgi:hypothetical protein